MADTSQISDHTRRARGRPRLEQVAIIESNVLDVALQEFLAHGYGGTAMRQIVKSAHISKTTLYSRFVSKEVLFRAIMRQQTERFSAWTSLGSPSGALNLAEGLKAYANRALAISLEGDLLAINRLITSESHRFPELGTAAAERCRLGVAQVAWFIEQCTQGEGRRVKNASAIAEVFILMLRGWYMNIMMTNGTVTAAEREAWVERVVAMLMAGREAW